MEPGLGGSVKAALGSSSTEASNYAVGAARAWEDGVNFNLTRQVSTFLSRSGPDVSPTALYVIEMGGNDVRDAFQTYIFGGPTGPVRAGEILTAALGSIAANIQTLYRAGARDFLVWSSPNIALTPAIRPLGPQAGGLAAGLAQSFNYNLTKGGRRTFSRASRCDLRPARRRTRFKRLSWHIPKTTVSPTPRPRALRPSVAPL